MASALKYFKSQTGLAGTTNDYIELAIRMADEQIGSDKETLKKLAAKFSLSITSIPRNYLSIISKMYIVSIYSYFDAFLLDLINDQAYDFKYKSFSKKMMIH